MGVLDQLFRAALYAEVERTLDTLEGIERMHCERGHRWSAYLESQTPYEQWSCTACQQAWDAIWDYAVWQVQWAIGKTIITAPLWLPWAILRRYLRITIRRG